jgi:hypothetical protein
MEHGRVQACRLVDADENGWRVQADTGNRCGGDASIAIFSARCNHGHSRRDTAHQGSQICMSFGLHEFLSIYIVNNIDK